MSAGNCCLEGEAASVWGPLPEHPTRYARILGTTSVDIDLFNVVVRWSLQIDAAMKRLVATLQDHDVNLGLVR